MTNKKYILKPGKHQFAPGSHPVHDNDNLTDAEAEWYLKAYPHIASLLEKSPKVGETESPEEAAPGKSKMKRKQIVQNQTGESASIKSISEIGVIT